MEQEQRQGTPSCHAGFTGEWFEPQQPVPAVADLHHVHKDMGGTCGQKDAHSHSNCFIAALAFKTASQTLLLGMPVFSETARKLPNSAYSFSISRLYQ